MTKIKNPAVNAVGNSSFELDTKQVGTASAAFDFQSRPVGSHGLKGPGVLSLRFKDIVSIHEHRQGKLFPACAVKEQRLSTTREVSANAVPGSSVQESFWKTFLFD